MYRQCTSLSVSVKYARPEVASQPIELAGIVARSSAHRAPHIDQAMALELAQKVSNLPAIHQQGVPATQRWIAKVSVKEFASGKSGHTATDVRAAWCACRGKATRVSRARVSSHW